MVNRGLTDNLRRNPKVRNVRIPDRRMRDSLAFSAASAGHPPRPANSASRDAGSAATPAAARRPDQQNHHRHQPKHRGACGKSRLEQDELAVALHQEVEHLHVAVAGLQAAPEPARADRAPAAHPNRRSTDSGRPCSAVPRRGHAPASQARDRTELRPAAPPAPASQRRTRPQS